MARHTRTFPKTPIKTIDPKRRTHQFKEGSSRDTFESKDMMVLQTVVRSRLSGCHSQTDLHSMTGMNRHAESSRTHVRVFYGFLQNSFAHLWLNPHWVSLILNQWSNQWMNHQDILNNFCIKVIKYCFLMIRHYSWQRNKYMASLQLCVILIIMIVFGKFIGNCFSIFC